MRSPFLWHGRSHPSPVRPKVELHDHTAHGSWRRYAKVTDRTDRPTDRMGALSIRKEGPTGRGVYKHAPWKSLAFACL